MPTFRGRREVAVQLKAFAHGAYRYDGRHYVVGQADRNTGEVRHRTMRAQRRTAIEAVIDSTRIGPLCAHCAWRSSRALCGGAGDLNLQMAKQRNQQPCGWFGRVDAGVGQVASALQAEAREVVFRTGSSPRATWETPTCMHGRDGHTHAVVIVMAIQGLMGASRRARR
jgi:hypothetical protein